MKALSQLYKDGIRREKHRGTKWYKTQPDGKCPDDETGLVHSYIQSFGCNPKDQPYLLLEHMGAAKTCASERMADMLHIVNKGKPADSDHVYPIVLAHGLGRKCASYAVGDTRQYDNDFRKWYTELVSAARNKHIDSLFKQRLQTNTQYPLESYNIDQNSSVKRAQLVTPQESARNIPTNPVIFNNAPVHPFAFNQKNANSNTNSTNTNSSLNDNNILRSAFISHKGGKRTRRKHVRRYAKHTRKHRK
jgi:hypothetical protein